MDLTLQQTAALLGQSIHQVRYLIRTGRLPATKVGGTWRVRTADLPKDTPRAQAAQQRVERLREVVEDTLGLPPRRARYSLRDMKAVQVGLPLLRAAAEALGPEHRAASHLNAALEQVALGCHRFRRQEKWDAYTQARDHASRAAWHLALSPAPEAPALLDTLEQELLPALAGLLRRMERGR